jgi:hypothetical protein
MRRYQTHAFPLLLLAGAFLLGATVFIWFFMTLPEGLSIDWPGLFRELRDGLPYRGHSLRIPPWSAVLLLPLALLPENAAWGLLNYITLTVLVISVPRIKSKTGYWLSILALVLSFPSLRHMADGNFEALIIAGVLLLIAGYTHKDPPLLAAGILLAASKPQVSVLLLAALGIYLLQTMPRDVIIRTALWILPVMIPTLLWKGRAWITAVFAVQQRGSLMDMSLQATLPRIGVGPDPLVWAALGMVILVSLGAAYASKRTFSREKAAMLMTASLLIAPYSAGNSMLSVLAIGIIPLAQRRLWIGGVLIVMVNVPFFLNTRRFADVQSNVQTTTLVTIWLVMLWQVWRAEIRPAPLDNNAAA